MLNHSILLLHPLKLSWAEYLTRRVNFLMSVSKDNREGICFSFFHVVSNINGFVIKRGRGSKSSSQIVAQYLSLDRLSGRQRPSPRSVFLWRKMKKRRR